MSRLFLIVITASFGGSKSATLTVDVGPSALTAISVSPASIAGGASSTGKVTISQPAPSGGLDITLASGDFSAKVPATVHVSTGDTGASFTVKSTAVTRVHHVVITSTLNGISKKANLILSPSALTALSVSPASIAGGASSTGKVTISPAAPSGGVDVTLTSGDFSAKVPATVHVSTGDTGANFTIKSTSVTRVHHVVITSTLNGMTKKANLILNPARQNAKNSLQWFQLTEATE